jgi:hypothetical protein
MAVYGGPEVVTDGLVLCLDAGNPKSYINGNNHITSIGRYSESATLINGVSYENSNGGVLSFDGANDYIRVFGDFGDTTNDRFAWTPSGSIGTSTISFEFWVKTADTEGSFVCKGWNWEGIYNYGIFHNSFNFGMDALSGATQDNVYTTFSTMATDRWEHGHFVITPTQYAIYRNGAINVPPTNHNITSSTPGSASSPESSRINRYQPLSIMTLFPYSFGGWDIPGHAVLGKLSNFKIYTRALSAEEVAQNFNALRGRFGL